MSLPNDPRPCGGDAYHSAWLYAHDDFLCIGCTRHYGAHRCLGSDGYAFFLLVAIEVAGERAETLRLTAVAMRQNGADRLGGTVIDITLYPGHDPRLVQDDWGWER